MNELDLLRSIKNAVWVIATLAIVYALLSTCGALLAILGL
jgi:hypothetical protein